MQIGRLFSPGPNISARRAFFYILLSTFCISGTFFSIFFARSLMTFFFSWPRFNITMIVQQSRTDESFPTALLCEMMDLSSDHPENLASFDTQLAEKRLLACSAIRLAHVEKMSPGRVYVEYEPRIPIANISDFSNTCIDETGVLFPMHPYFTFKKLPEVYFGEEKKGSSLWGERVDPEKCSLFLELLHSFKKERIARLDLSLMRHESLGQREIDLVLQGGTTLRLNPDNFRHQLHNFASLQLKKPCVVDLRVTDVAYIEKKMP